MINSTIMGNHVFLAMGWGSLWAGSLFFLFVPIILVATLVLMYFKLVKQKEVAAFEGEKLHKIIDGLMKTNALRSKEIELLELKLKNGEKEWNAWDVREKMLIKKIKGLEAKVEDLKMNVNIVKEDVIIEYYMSKN